MSTHLHAASMVQYIAQLNFTSRKPCNPVLKQAFGSLPRKERDENDT